MEAEADKIADLHAIARKKKSRLFTVPPLEILRSADDLFRNDCSYLQTGQFTLLLLLPKLVQAILSLLRTFK